MRRIGVIVFGVVFLVLNLMPNRVFSVSGESQVEIRVEVAPVIVFYLNSHDQLTGVTNTENALVILEKNSDGQKIYHPAEEKVFLNPLSAYTLISKI